MTVGSSILRAAVNPDFVYHGAILPYGLTAGEIVKGIEATYELLYEVNNFLVGKGLDRLEDLILGNSLSGIISELLVKNVALHSRTVARNERVGGHPDLIPIDTYPGNCILRGEAGLEVKSSKQSGGWQGHNAEATWVVIFRYVLDERENPLPYDRVAITFIQVLAARLELDDWSFSGRSETSRRTITASINQRGMDKLRSNPIYQDPRYIVAPNAILREKYLSIPRQR